MLTATPTGLRLCKRLLDGMITLYEAEEISDGGKAFDVGYVLQSDGIVGILMNVTRRYSIFTRLIEHGLAPNLYIRLSMSVPFFSPLPAAELLLFLTARMNPSLPIRLRC
jgi:ataxin-10